MSSLSFIENGIIAATRTNIAITRSLIDNISYKIFGVRVKSLPIALKYKWIIHRSSPYGYAKGCYLDIRPTKNHFGTSFLNTNWGGGQHIFKLMRPS